MPTAAPHSRHVSRFDRFALSCGATRFMRRIGGRWKIQAVWTLREGKMRFAQLTRALPGITQAMLSQQLRELEQDGFVERVVHPVIPPNVDYSLTEKGRSLLDLLERIDTWTNENLPFGD